MVNKASKIAITEKDILFSKSNMPLTASIASMFNNVLEDTIVLHINHTLTDVYAFNTYLTDNLKAEVVFIGVPYNNRYALPNYKHHYSLRENLTFTPYLNGSKNKDINSELDYIDLIKNQINFSIERYILPNIENKKVMIIQDGGYTSFLSKGSNSILDLYSHKNFLGIIEQTASGTKLLTANMHEQNLNIPVISIAKSETKSSVEAHFIGNSVFFAIQDIFRQMGLFLSFKSVIIGGYGIIGRTLALLLRNFEVHVHIKEIDPILIKLARREGFQCAYNLEREDFEDKTLYVGCTGQESFGLSELDLFLKSNETCFYLASGSSKRVEFWQLIKTFEQLWEKDANLKLVNPSLAKIKNFTVKDSHFGLKYVFELENGLHKELTLLGEGFPINFFDPTKDGVPDRAIDLTQATLLHSAILLKTEVNTIARNLNFYCQNNTIGEFKVDENTLLFKWMQFNKIYLDYSYPLENFGLHPLRNYLKEKRYRVVKGKDERN